MWVLDYKEGWVLKNWFFWSIVLKKTLESPLDCKEIQPVHPKGDQSWVFTGRTDAEAETPILWPPDGKSWLTGKDPDSGKDWRQEEEGDDRGWDGWMTSPTRRTWVWVSSGSWWWTGKPGMLQSMGLQRVGHDWATEQQQKDLRFLKTHRQTKLSPTLMDKRKGHGWLDDVYRSWGPAGRVLIWSHSLKRKKGV